MNIGTDVSRAIDSEIGAAAGVLTRDLGFVDSSNDVIHLQQE